MTSSPGDCRPQRSGKAAGAERRVIRDAGRYVLVLGVADSGEHLAVLVDPAEDGSWDVVAARRMDRAEVAAFDHVTGRTHE